MLIAGTSIGIGMLTLPSVIASAGLAYGLLVTIIVWLFMWLSAKAFAELSWNMPLGTNMLSMSEYTLGKIGKILMGGCYVLLLYALSSAYLSSLVALSSSLYSVSDFALFFWVVVLGVVLASKFSILNSLNQFMMLVMVLSFSILVFGLSYSTSHVEHLLLFGSTKVAMGAIPVMITSFGYQIVVPSIHNNLGKGDPEMLKKVLLWGSLLPLVFYILWILVMMQQVSQTTFQSMLNSGQPVALLPQYMANILNKAWVQPLCLVLVCSAIGTSWLGVSLSILDFVKDSKLSRYAMLLTLVPPMLFVKFYPNGFLTALKYSGYLVAILLIIFPAIMLLSLRKSSKTKHQFISKEALALVLIFGITTVLL